MAFSSAANFAARLKELAAKNTALPTAPRITTYQSPVSGGQASEFYTPPKPTTVKPPAYSGAVSLEPGLSYGGPSGIGQPTTPLGTRAVTGGPAKSGMSTTGTSGGGGYSSGGGGYSSGGGGGGGYSSGGGGGGGGGAIGIPAPSVGEPLTGFAARYQPGGIQEVLNQPGVIARDVLESLGINSNELGNLYSNQASYFASQILPLLYGQDAIGSVPSAGGMVNRTAEYLQNLATPGGSVIDPMQLLQMVLAESRKPVAGQQSLLSSLFAGQTPMQQRQSMTDIVNDLSNWAPSPLMTQALRSWIARQGDEYARQALRANQPYQSPFGSFLSTGPNASILPR